MKSKLLSKLALAPAMLLAAPPDPYIMPVEVTNESLTVEGTVDAVLDEPVEVEGTVNAVLDEPIAVEVQSVQPSKTAWTEAFVLDFDPGDSWTEECSTYLGADVLVLQNINGGFGQDEIDNPQLRLTISDPSQYYGFAAERVDQGPGVFSIQHLVQEQFVAYVKRITGWLSSFSPLGIYRKDLHHLSLSAHRLSV